MTYNFADTVGGLVDSVDKFTAFLFDSVCLVDTLATPVRHHLNVAMQLVSELGSRTVNWHAPERKVAVSTIN